MKPLHVLFEEMKTIEWWTTVPNQSDLTDHKEPFHVTAVLLDGEQGETQARMMILVGDDGSNLMWEVDKDDGQWDCVDATGENITLQSSDRHELWVTVDKAALHDVPYPVKVEDEEILRLVNDIIAMSGV